MGLSVLRVRNACSSLSRVLKPCANADRGVLVSRWLCDTKDSSGPGDATRVISIDRSAIESAKGGPSARAAAQIREQIQAAPNATPLAQKLIELIARGTTGGAGKGPLSVAEFMRSCLRDPEYGYYTRKVDVLGSRGDFVTAPEVSQVFGELLGVWCVTMMDQIFSRSTDAAHTTHRVIQLIELGPGRGVMMADALRAVRALRPQYLARTAVRLVEISPKFRSVQRESLSAFLDKPEGIDLSWHTTVEEALGAISATEHAPLILAQEFFDAFPVLQFQRSRQDSVGSSRHSDDGWREVLVDVVPAKSSLPKDAVAGGHPIPPSVEQSSCATDKVTFGTLQLVRAPGRTMSNVYLEDVVFKPAVQSAQNSKDPCVLEISPEAIITIMRVASCIRQSSLGGAALVIDYCHDETPARHTVRAIRKHTFESILDAPGLADVTADVDFNALLRAVEFSNVQARNRASRSSASTSSASSSLDEARAASREADVIPYSAVSQANFLAELGVRERFHRLAQRVGSDEKALAQLQSDYDRLMSPKHMGTLYKVFGIASSRTPLMAGFSTSKRDRYMYQSDEAPFHDSAEGNNDKEQDRSGS